MESASLITSDKFAPTSRHLLDIVQNQVHELIVAFERSRHYNIGQLCSFAGISLQMPTLSAAVELHTDLLVHVFGKVQDILLLAVAALSIGTATSTTVSTASTSAISTTAASASEIRAF
jgi:hypothetical protein